MIVSGDNETGILHFQKRRQEVHGDSYLVLYDANLDAHVFVYLYLRSATCSLVWKGPQGSQFDTTLPFEFFDTQFNNLAPSRIANIKRSVEKYGSSMLHKPYKFTKHWVTLFLAGEERLREYDLGNAPEKYKTEIVESRDALAKIAFARFDSDIEYQGQREELKGQRLSYSLTFERLGDSASEDWEFTISIPRGLELEEATLKWIARHHKISEMLRMNFKASLDELSKMIKPQTDPIYA